MQKRGLEFSFSWLFAIIAGAAIIFMAIYGAMSFINTGQNVENTKLAKQISVIFNPLDTGMASGKSTQAKLTAETRIYNRCYLEGSFGKQEFSTSQKSGFGKEWPNPGGATTIYSKYVFSDEIEQGKTFYFFSKPFKMPFKISELIFLSGKSYCFINPPNEIEDEIRSLQLKNVFLENNCTSKDIRVCFGSGGCDIDVTGECSGINCESDYDFGSVEKKGESVYYAGSLVYGAIFSNPEIYECNFKRLMLRIKQIAKLYDNEASFTSPVCGDVISMSLLKLSQAAETADAQSMQSIVNLKEAAKELDEQNSAQKNCRIYENE